MLALVQKTVSLNNHSLFKIMSKIASTGGLVPSGPVGGPSGTSFFFLKKKNNVFHIYEKQVPEGQELVPREQVPRGTSIVFYKNK